MNAVLVSRPLFALIPTPRKGHLCVTGYKDGRTVRFYFTRPRPTVQCSMALKRHGYTTQFGVNY